MRVWRQIIEAVSEHTDRPFAVLDRRGAIQYLNPALERLLGRKWREAEGQEWCTAIAPEDASAPFQRDLERAQRGQRLLIESVAAIPSGRIRLALELSPIGSGATLGLVAVVNRAWSDTQAAVSSPHRDCLYEISTAAGSFGRLKRLVIDGLAIPLVDARQHCFRVLHQRPEPCADCPLTERDGQGWPRLHVRALAAADRRCRGPFEVMHARLIGEGQVEVRSRSLTSEVLSAVKEARVACLIEQGGLTARESAVFRRLLSGGEIDDIARELGLAGRTVKHHQTQLLRKLGVDSRARLLQLASFAEPAG